MLKFIPDKPNIASLLFSLFVAIATIILEMLLPEETSTIQLSKSCAIYVAGLILAVFVGLLTYIFSSKALLIKQKRRRKRISIWRRELQNKKNKGEFYRPTMAIELSTYLSATENKQLLQIQKQQGIIVMGSGNGHEIITKSGMLFSFYSKVILRLEKEWKLI